jgi:acyl-CoA synthetase (AMP-forming)/AMP-acid ligase II
MLFTVLELLKNTSIKFPDKPMIFEGELEISFEEVYRLSLATACALRTSGVQPGDRVGICMAKSTEQVLSILGCLFANAIFVPILPSLKSNSIEHIIKNSGMGVVITDDFRVAEIEKFKSSVKIFQYSQRREGLYPDLSRQRVPFYESAPIFFDRISSDLAAIIYSSGSTGMPKGIMVTHRNLADGARIVSSYLDTTSDDRIAAILSFNFDYGLNQLWQSMMTGASIHLHELVFPNDALRFIEEQKITVLPLMPAIISRIFDRRFLDLHRNLNFDYVRCITSSGGRLSAEMLADILKYFPAADFYSMYGLTEAFRSTYLEPEQLKLRPTSIGKAIPDVEIIILDENGNECQPNQVGELVHRGGCITKGYWNDEVRTAERFKVLPRYPGEVVVFSGDFAYKDVDGYLFFDGRIDGMLKNNGIRISPTEIEAAFDEIGQVSEVVVFGIDNIAVGNDIVAVYTTHDLQPIEEITLIASLKRGLSSHMLPKYFIHMQSFPVTGNQGKIDRVNIRDLALKNFPFE